MNIWLFVVIQSITSVIVTFVLIVGLLVTDSASSGWSFLWCFFIGLLVSLPIAWKIGKGLTKDVNDA